MRCETGPGGGISIAIAFAFRVPAVAAAVAAVVVAVEVAPNLGVPLESPTSTQPFETVRCGEKFHNRRSPAATDDVVEAALAAAATTAVVVLFTTFAISEQFVSDADVRTFDDDPAAAAAVTRSGTVHVALNEADR